MRSFTISILILATCIFYSCGGKPTYVLSEDEMMELLYDIRLAQAIYSNNDNFQSDSVKDLLVAGVFEKHNVTQAIFDSSLVWYADNIAKYRVINDSVSSRLRAQGELMMHQLNSQNANLARGDGRSSFYTINQYTPTFRFNMDSTKLKGVDLNSFRFSFDALGLNSKQVVKAALYFTYKDTLIINDLQLTEDKVYTFTKPHLPDSLLKNISGYVHSDIKAGDQFKMIMYNISYSDSIKENLSDDVGTGQGRSMNRNNKNRVGAGDVKPTTLP